jgi:hypothetical protein
VFIFLSVSSIVTPAAKTGIAKTKRNAVNNTDQQNKDMRFIVSPPDLIKPIVTIKFIDPKIEENPAK